MSPFNPFRLSPASGHTGMGSAGNILVMMLQNPFFSNGKRVGGDDVDVWRRSLIVYSIFMVVFYIRGFLYPDMVDKALCQP